MDEREIVLAIADGTVSVRRIKRIAKAAYGVTLDPKLIAQITAFAVITTPQRKSSNNPLENQYPDQWSILLEARGFWVRVRRYWGDSAANDLKTAIALSSAGRWRGLREQFERYIDPAIQERCKLDMDSLEIQSPLELESLYSWELQRDLYLQAYEQEFEDNPAVQSGAKFPLPSPEWKEFKQQKFKEDCLKAFNFKIESEEKLIQLFADFWSEVYHNRGDRYFENLKRALVGVPATSLSQRPFYSSTEDNFRHFLSNLHGFKISAPWNIVKIHEPRPPMALEGAIFKYGWKKVQSMAALGILTANY